MLMCAAYNKVAHAMFIQGLNIFMADSMYRKVILGNLSCLGHLENPFSEVKHQASVMILVKKIGSAPKVAFTNISTYTIKSRMMTAGFGNIIRRRRVFHLFDNPFICKELCYFVIFVSLFIHHHRKGLEKFSTFWWQSKK